ncbi:MAG: hypothetical protein IT373_32150 [Polyangiaceae bacterium]|nr:hypothetical protein [Polyangiaceae bacterium]
MELLAYRLNAAALGLPSAVLGALVAPAAMGLGAVALASRRADPVRRLRAVAYTASGAGMAWVAALVTLVWQAHQPASAHLAAWQGYLVLGALSVGFCLAGAALGGLYRAGALALGRFGAAEALGGVVAALAVPGALALGAPRAALLLALAFGLVALVLARGSGARWSVLATQPLAILALFAGDFGAPWLKIRLEVTPKQGAVDVQVWTDTGFVTVLKPTRGAAQLTVDGSEALEVTAAGGKRPAAKPVDILYALEGRTDASVLVVGSAGGREVAAALANGYAAVHAAERNAGLLRLLLAPGRPPIALREGAVTTELASGAPRRAPPDVRHVVVVDAVRFATAPPRLLGWSDRGLGEHALRGYLAHTADDGVLVLSVRPDALAATTAAARSALDLPEAEADKHLFVCSAPEGDAALVVSPGDISRGGLAKLRNFCRKNHFTTLESGTLEPAEHRVSEDRPFVDGLPGIGELARRALDELGRPVSDPPDPKASRLEDREVPLGALFAGLLVTLVVALVGAVVPPPRGEAPGGLGVKARRMGLLARLALLTLGAALGLAQLVVGEHALRLLGHTSYAWGVVVPVWLVGVAAGRLAHAESARRPRLALGVGAALGVAFLVAVALLAPRWSAVESLSLAARAAVVLGLALAGGAFVGGPAFGVLAHAAEPAARGHGWGLALLGWAAGAAAAALGVRAAGMSGLLFAAAAVLAVGAALGAVARRAAPPDPSAGGG